MPTPNPIYKRVDGAPFQPGDIVLVVKVEDLEDMDYVGKTGIVLYLEYSCGCGQSYPADPMIGVVFSDMPDFEFWKEELVLNERMQS